VIIDDAGRPVLCGFGTAVAHRDLVEARRRSAEDVGALTVLLTKLGEGAPPRAVARVLRSCSRRRFGSTPLNARRVARALVNALPDARLPSVSAVSAAMAACPSPNSCTALIRFDRRKTQALAVLLTGLAVACLTVIYRPHDPARHTFACPLADNGCAPQAVRSGSIISGPNGKFMLLGVSGIEIVGRWLCTTPLPVVLDVSRGDVWTFRDWPGAPGGSSAQLAQEVPHATGLRILPGSGRKSGCDSLFVERRHLSPVFVAFDRTR
jgi:hypothetical protein